MSGRAGRSSITVPRSAGSAGSGNARSPTRGSSPPGWLSMPATGKRHPERVREELLGHCRDELIEPPSANRISRIISSALHQADTALTVRISASIRAAAAARMLALIAEASDDPGRDGNGREAFYRGRNKPASQKDANRAHAQLRSPGERANARLKNWHILRKLRCCPWKARAAGQGHPCPSSPRDRRMKKAQCIVA